MFGRVGDLAYERDDIYMEKKTCGILVCTLSATSNHVTKKNCNIIMIWEYVIFTDLNRFNIPVIKRQKKNSLLIS